MLPFLHRDAAHHQQPLWLRLHLPRRNTSGIYWWWWRASSHWCECLV